MLVASLCPDSHHKHTPVAENRLKAFVQTPDLAEEKVQKAAGDGEAQLSP